MEETEIVEKLQKYNLSEEESKNFLPHPGFEGNKFSDGQTVYGHATLDQINNCVVKVRLFNKESEARNDLAEFHNPYGLSVLFKSRIVYNSKSEHQTANLNDLSILKKKNGNN